LYHVVRHIYWKGLDVAADNNQPVAAHPPVPNPSLPANHQNPSDAAKVVLGPNGSLAIPIVSTVYKSIKRV